MILLCLFIVSVLLVLSNIGLQAKLKAAERDTEAWKAVAMAYESAHGGRITSTTTFGPVTSAAHRSGTWH